MAVEIGRRFSVFAAASVEALARSVSEYARAVYVDLESLADETNALREDADGLRVDVDALDDDDTIATNTSDTLTASVIGATTETAFAQYADIPANAISRASGVELFLGFQTVSTAGPNLRVRVRAGGVAGTAMYSTSFSSSPIAGTSGNGVALLITGEQPPSSSANTVTLPVGSTSWATVDRMYNQTAQPVALSTSAPLRLNVTAEYSANTAGNSVTLCHLRWRKVGAR